MAQTHGLFKRVGRRLAQLRRWRGFNQEDLAGKAGISRTYLGALEAGMKAASLKVYDRLANALGVKLPALFDEPDAEHARSR